MALLEVSGIHVQEEGNTVLEGISFTQQAYQNIVLAGETGSGKSTLMQTVAGLVHPAAGQVLFEQKRVQSPHDVLVPGHPGIAYLSQQFELPQFLRVEQILKYANSLAPDEADALYELCRITHLLKRKTNQLSGGERQRIALARLLSTWPSLLLLDEPFSNLDMGHKQILKAVIHDIGEELGITCMLISHDPLDTLSWADKILVLRAGKLVQQASPNIIYRQPANEYVASLFGGYNLIPAAKAKAFAKQFKLDLPAKDLIIRPEAFNIETEKASAAKGSIKQVTYYGSYCELSVQLDSSLVKVKTPAAAFAKGDQVWVSLSKEAVWVLP